jgi:antibiotic biosynthesis monooxygenase (ABM) superfamily enzyme
MPPPKEVRRILTPVPTTRVPIALPEFTDSGVMLAITYSIREGRRHEFFDLLRELKPLLAAIGGHDCTVFEDRSRPNYLMEVFRFKDEAEFTAFDDKFHKDRKIAAIYALLDDIVEAEKSDFKIFERRL